MKKVEVKVTQLCLTLCNPMDYTNPWNSPGQHTGVGSCSLFWGIFPAQGRSNPGLQHCRQIFYQLSYMLTDLILTTIQCSRHYYSPHFIDWEIKAQRR